MTKDRLMTTAELAEYLDVPLSTVRHWRLTGAGPRAIHIGRHLRFRPKDVEDWLEKRADPAA